MSDTEASARPFLITWLDSRQPVPGWQLLDDIEVPDVCRCQTVGFIVQEDEELLCIAQSVADLGGKHPQASGVMAIPVRAVVERREL